MLVLTWSLPATAEWPGSPLHLTDLFKASKYARHVKKQCVLMCEQVNRGYFEFMYPLTAQKWLSKHPSSIIFLALSSCSIFFFSLSFVECLT